MATHLQYANETPLWELLLSKIQSVGSLQLFFKFPDVRQVSHSFGSVETIAKHIRIFNIKADKIWSD